MNDNAKTLPKPNPKSIVSFDPESGLAGWVAARGTSDPACRSDKSSARPGDEVGPAVSTQGTSVRADEPRRPERSEDRGERADRTRPTDSVELNFEDMHFSPQGPTSLNLDTSPFITNGPVELANTPVFAPMQGRTTTYEPGDILPKGTQWRFVFDMTTCIGCHACEVACGEQNGLPTDTAWRRVGEIEIGSFPTTRRFHMSMACNHCVNPTCLTGCPANAYVKHKEGPLSGIVAHLDDECIGCGYCTWTCSYEVPVFQPDRRIVTKCDMCAPRMVEGRGPACAEVCPTNAIRIEPVVIADWSDDHQLANSPGIASSHISVSTTKMILPSELRADGPIAAGVAFADDAIRYGDDYRIEPEHAHLPLVVLTVASQAAIGTSVWTAVNPSVTSAVLAGVFAAIGLAASPFHLGRPIHALRALRNIRRSWLSREALLLALHGGGAISLGAATVLGIGMSSNSAANAANTAKSANTETSMQPLSQLATTPMLRMLFALVAVVGVLGAYSSARLYMLPGRPTWDTKLTLVQFGATTVGLGSLLTGHRITGSVGVLLGVLIEMRRLSMDRADRELGTRRNAILRARRILNGPLATSKRLRFATAALAIVTAVVAEINASHPLSDLSPASLRHLSLLSLLTGSIAILAAISSELIGRTLFIQTGIGLRIPGRFNQPYDVEGPSDYRSHRGSGDYLHAGDHLHNGHREPSEPNEPSGTSETTESSGTGENVAPDSGQILRSLKVPA
jgi:formate dehydrogenase iron-sulfur subunit